MDIGWIAYSVLAAADDSAAQTFFRQFFVQGGPIVWFILLPMSIIIVYLALDLLVTIRRKRLLPAGIATEIATHALRNGPASLSNKLVGRKDLLSRALLRAMDQGRQMGASSEMIRQLTAESLAENGMHLMRKAQWCQIIGSVAPMVGLFGTVFGMIGAFHLLGQGTEGQRYELLADKISIALVTTFWGLLVAIPALFLYGVFQTRIEAFVSEASLEAEAVLARIFANGNAKGFKVVAQPQPQQQATAAKPNQAKVPQQPKGTFIRRKQKRLKSQTPKPRIAKRKNEPQPAAKAAE